MCNYLTIWDYPFPCFMIPKMTNGPSHSPIAIQKMNQKFVKETSLALVWVPCTEA